MRLAAAAVLLSAVLVSTTATSAAAEVAAPVRVTFVGDSVAGSLSYVPRARAQLARGFSMRLDLEVCRRLVQTSCPFQGVRPTTALQAVQSYGRSLGRVLIVKVGYNESGQAYAAGIDLVMRAALSQGARGVVWVTLRETTTVYRPANLAIRAAVKRWPQLVVADWQEYSRGRAWFRPDGLHLTPDGALAFVTFLRPYVRKAAAVPPS
jgi:hypothetical protein